jgi:hypothetical protein
LEPTKRYPKLDLLSTKGKGLQLHSSHPVLVWR